MRRGLKLTAWSLALAAAFVVLHHFFTNPFGDPDRYYHFALSRLMAESGSLFLRAVPQVEGLGWHEYFVDKEFLFHQLTSLGYRVAGENGVIAGGVLCGIFSILAFFWFASTRVPVGAAAAFAALTFSSPYLLSRMMLIRPHTLAVLTFTLMNIAVISRRPKLTAITTALFVLSYHAFYLPLVCFIWLALVSQVLAQGEDLRAWLRVVGFGAFGCVCGVLLNPYFPGNLVLGWIHARIPYLMKHDLKHLVFGQELLPARADDLLQMFGGPLLAIFALMLFAGSEARASLEKKEKSLVDLVFLLGTSVLFLLMSFQVIRAGEYLVPSVGLALVVAAARITNWRGWHFAALGLVFLAQGCFDVVFLADAVKPIDTKRIDRTFAAIAAIPESAKGALVYNCEWDRSPFLMYKRPDLRFIDILDPSLLYFHNQLASHAKEDLRNGLVADAYGMISKAFKADYVLCEDAATVNQLRMDPGFELLHPKENGPGVIGQGAALFAVKKEIAVPFVRSLEFHLVKSVTKEEMLAIAPPPEAKPIRVLDLEKSPYLNLEAAFGMELKKDEKGYHCAVVSPEAPELRRLSGARFLALGGGQGIRVWRNGQPIFHTLSGFRRAQTTQVVLPLEPPLSDRDRLEVLACTEAKELFWGVSLALYTPAELRKICGPEKKEFWPYQEVNAEVCIGAMATPGFRSALEKAAPPLKHGKQGR